MHLLSSANVSSFRGGTCLKANETPFLNWHTEWPLTLCPLVAAVALEKIDNTLFYSKKTSKQNNRWQIALLSPALSLLFRLKGLLPTAPFQATSLPTHPSRHTSPPPPQHFQHTLDTSFPRRNPFKKASTHAFVGVSHHWPLFQASKVLLYIYDKHVPFRQRRPLKVAHVGVRSPDRQLPWTLGDFSGRRPGCGGTDGQSIARRAPWPG